MSAGKKFGDECNTFECPNCKDGICQRFKDIYDEDVPMINKLTSLMTFVAKYQDIQEEVNEEMKIAKELFKHIVSGDISDDIEEMLTEIENKIKE